MEPSITISMRDEVGNRHFMKQLERDYKFPVEVYKAEDDGTRELIRVEH